MVWASRSRQTQQTESLCGALIIWCAQPPVGSYVVEATENVPAPTSDACMYTWNAKMADDVQATFDNAKGIKCKVQAVKYGHMYKEMTSVMYRIQLNIVDA